MANTFAQPVRRHAARATNAPRVVRHPPAPSGGASGGVPNYLRGGQDQDGGRGANGNGSGTTASEAPVPPSAGASAVGVAAEGGADGTAQDGGGDAVTPADAGAGEGGAGATDGVTGGTGGQDLEGHRIAQGEDGKRYDCGMRKPRGKPFAFPAYFPPPSARIGMTQLTPVRQAPRMEAEESRRHRRKTGLTPDEHHDRIRQAGARISRAARMGQVSMIHTAEQMGAGCKLDIEALKPFLRAAIGGAIGTVRAEAASVKSELERVRSAMVGEVDREHAVFIRTSEQTRDDATSQMWTAMSTESADINAAADGLREAYGRHVATAKAAMAAIPRTGTASLLLGESAEPGDAPTTVAEAERALLAELQSDGSNTDRIRSWQNSQLVRAVPGAATAYQAKLVESNNASRDRLDAGATVEELFLSALGISSPVARPIREDQHDDTGGAERSVDEDISSIERSRRATRNYLNGAVAGVVTNIDLCLLPDMEAGIRTAGRRALAALQAQADAAERVLLGNAAPMAAEFTMFREAFAALVPDDGMLDHPQLAKPLQRLLESAQDLSEEQSGLLRAQRAELFSSAQKMLGESRRSLASAGSQSARSLTSVGARAQADLLLTAARFAGPDLIRMNSNIVEQARQFVEETARRLLTAKGQVHTELSALEDAAVNFLNGRISDAIRNYNRASKGMGAHFENVGPFKQYRSSIAGDLSTRAGAILVATPEESTATDYLLFGVAGALYLENADEEAVFQQLSLPWPGAPAVEQTFDESPQFPGTLRARIRDRMDSGDAQTAIQLLGASTHTSARLRIASDSSGILGTLFGHSSETRQAALSGLTRSDLLALQSTDSGRALLDSTRDDLEWLPGSSESLALAYLHTGEDREDGILAVRFEQSFEQAHNDDEQALITATQQMDQIIAQELTGTATATWVPGEVLGERRTAGVDAWAQRYRANEMRSDNSSEHARQLFVDHVTRDQDIVDPTLLMVGSSMVGPGAAVMTGALIASGANRREVDQNVRDYIAASLREGTDSDAARAHLVAYDVEESEESGEPSQDAVSRINEQISNPELSSLKHRFERETDPERKADLGRELERAQARHDERLSVLALALADQDTIDRKGGPESYLQGRIGAVMTSANEEFGQTFADSLISDGRSDLHSGIRMATDMAGTNEGLLRQVRANRYAAEWEQASEAYGTDSLGLNLREMLIGVPIRDASPAQLLLLATSPLAYMHAFGGEVSGDEAMATERDMLGIPETDEDYAQLATLRYQQERLRGTGLLGSVVMSGSEEEGVIDGERARFGALLLEGAALSNEPVPDSAFLPDGRIDPHVLALAFHQGEFRGDSARLREVPANMDRAAVVYQAGLQRYESYMTTVIDVVTTVASVIASFFGPIGMAVGVLITLVGGMAKMLVKAAMRGERYGWEEAAEDYAMVVVDVAVQAATLGFGKGLSKPGTAIARGLATAGSKAEATIAKISGAMIREAVTGAVASGSQVAIQDETWNEGGGEGLRRVFSAGARGALVGAATAGVSEGLETGLKHLTRAGGLLEGLSERLGPGVAGSAREAASEALGAMAGETVGVLYDVGAGNYRGTFVDAVKGIGIAGLRDMVTGAVRGAGGHHFRTQYSRLMAHARRGGSMTDQDWTLLRLSGMAAGELKLTDGAEAVRSQVRGGRQELAALPPRVRAQLEGASLDTLSQVRQALAHGGFANEAVRHQLLEGLREADASFDDDSFLRALNTVSQRLHGRDLGVLDAAVQRRLAEDQDALPGQRRRAEDDDAVGHLPESQRRHADAIIARGKFLDGELAAFIATAQRTTPDVDVARLREQLVGALQRARPESESLASRDVGDATEERAGAVSEAEGPPGRQDGAADATPERSQAEVERLRQEEVSDREALLSSLPLAQRAQLSELSRPAFAQFRSLLESGQRGTPDQRVALLRAARADGADIDGQALLRGLDTAVRQREFSMNAARRERRKARLERLQGLPRPLRGPLSALPDSALWHIQDVQLRRLQPSPYLRAELLRQARLETPGVDARAFFQALDQTAARARGEVSVPERRAQQLRGELNRLIPKALRGEFEAVPVSVVTDARFQELTQSQKGQAVTLIVDGRPHVLIRESADPRVLGEEGVHLMQLRDPEWQQRMGALDETKLGRWPELSVAEQLVLYRNKVDVEVDAQERLLGHLYQRMASGDGDVLRLRAEADEVSQTLQNLKRRRDEAQAIGFLRRGAMTLGLSRRPGFLDQPARLFSKRDKPGTVGHPDDNREPIPARRARLRAEVLEARRENREADRALHSEIQKVPLEVDKATGDLHHKKVYEHIGLGAGSAGLGNAMLRPRTEGEHLLIGQNAPWRDSPDEQFLGQGAFGGVELAGRPRGDFAEFVAEPDAPYARSSEYADYLEVTRAREGLAVYPGQSGPLQRRRDDWPEWAIEAGARVRVPVAGPDGIVRFFYAKSVDVASGPGPARQLDASVLNAEVRQKLEQAGLLHAADQRFPGAELDGDLGDVAVIGSGPAGAWAVESTAHRGRVEWFGQIRQVHALPPELRSVYDRLRSGTEPVTDAERAQLRRWTFEEQPGHGNFPRNQGPGKAFDPDLPITRTAYRDLERIGYELDPTTGRERIALYFADAPETPVWKDRLVLAIGQDATGPGGPAHLLSAFDGKLLPIFGPLDAEGRRPIVGLESGDESVRVLGAAAVGAVGLVETTEMQAQIRASWADEADAFPVDSRGVIGGFFHTRQMLEAANLPYQPPPRSGQAAAQHHYDERRIQEVATSIVDGNLRRLLTQPPKTETSHRVRNFLRAHDYDPAELTAAWERFRAGRKAQRAGNPAAMKSTTFLEFLTHRYGGNRGPMLGNMHVDSLPGSHASQALSVLQRTEKRLFKALMLGELRPRFHQRIMQRLSKPPPLIPDGVQTLASASRRVRRAVLAVAVSEARTLEELQGVMRFLQIPMSAGDMGEFWVALNMAGSYARLPYERVLSDTDRLNEPPLAHVIPDRRLSLPGYQPEYPFRALVELKTGYEDLPVSERQAQRYSAAVREGHAPAYVYLFIPREPGGSRRAAVRRHAQLMAIRDPSLDPMPIVLYLNDVGQVVQYRGRGHSPVVVGSTMEDIAGHVAAQLSSNR